MGASTIAAGVERPYRPGWVDRFNQWVQRLPVRAWLFFLLFGIVLIAVQILFLWLDGGLQFTELLPVMLFNAAFTPFLLALVYFLDLQAVTALNSMKPALLMSELEIDRTQYLLANMPARATWMAGLTSLLIVILMERLWIMPARYAALEQLHFFNLVFQIIDKSSAFLFGVLIYHTIRQLRLVNTILMNHTRINLFQLKPLQAFSKLTASTALGLVVGVYAWILINPELLKDAVILGLAGLATLTAVAVFAWPMLGVHRLMETQKDSMLQALDQNFEAAFSKFNQGLQEDDYALMEKLNGTIASLEIQRKRLSAIPTWPWRSETARFVLTAIALPLLLTVLQFLVLQAFGG